MSLVIMCCFVLLPSCCFHQGTELEKQKPSFRTDSAASSSRKWGNTSWAPSSWSTASHCETWDMPRHAMTCCETMLMILCYWCSCFGLLSTKEISKPRELHPRPAGPRCELHPRWPAAKWPPPSSRGPTRHPWRWWKQSSVPQLR